MFRLFTPLTLLFIVVLTLALLLIRAQPYEDSQLRAWLLPKGCSAPCFMGIKPGVTTADEAMQILKASPLVEQVGYQFGSTLIRIKWKADVPWWMADNGNGGTFMETVNGMVTKVRISGDLTLGDIQLIYGRTPLQYIIVGYLNGNAFFVYSTVYLNGVMASITKACDDRNDRIRLYDTVALDYIPVIHEADLPRQYRNSWGDVLHASCT